LYIGRQAKLAIARAQNYASLRRSQSRIFPEFFSKRSATGHCREVCRQRSRPHVEPARCFFIPYDKGSIMSRPNFRNVFDALCRLAGLRADLWQNQWRKQRPTVRLRLEVLEERWCPTTAQTLYWNPAGGSTDASLKTNWHVTTLNGANPDAAPGNDSTTKDTIIFDGTSNSSASNCSWNYNPTYVFGGVKFQNAYKAKSGVPGTGTITFSTGDGFRDCPICEQKYIIKSRTGVDASWGFQRRISSKQ
jgi:hypothetical protein